VCGGVVGGGCGEGVIDVGVWGWGGGGGERNGGVGGGGGGGGGGSLCMRTHWSLKRRDSLLLLQKFTGRL